MKVYFNKRLIVIESNIEWAIIYWTERKRLNNSITFKII